MIELHSRTALDQRRDDPGVVEWKRRMVELLQASARQGDRAAMVVLSNAYQGVNGLAQREPQEALVYWSAQNELTRMSGARVSRGAARVSAALSAGMPPEKVKEAVEKGRLIAARCCSS